MKVLVVQALDQFLTEQQDEEALEGEYRRGYLDGYGKVLADLVDLFPVGIEMDVRVARAFTRLFRFYHEDLTAWREGPLSMETPPPEVQRGERG